MLSQVLESLKNQSLHYSKWELLIIDNNSEIGKLEDLSMSWQPNSKIIFEPKVGLTFARLKGFSDSKSDLVLMVDDDNILGENYLEECISIFNEDPKIGALGGKSIPLFMNTPPIWLSHFYLNLALRDFGNEISIENWSGLYPDKAPIGAGMAVRKVALQSYIQKNNSNKSKISDRSGTSLSSGGDNDIILEILKSGWSVGYFPILSLQHIIPGNRMKKSYLARLNKDSTKSWIKVLDIHGINPWKKIPAWTVPLRKIKATLLHKPWRNPVNYIKWKGVCGMYEALGEL